VNRGGSSPSGTGNTSIGVNRSVGGEYVAGVFQEDAIEVISYDSGALGLEALVVLTSEVNQALFGNSAVFCGNLDQDRAVLIEIIVGCPFSDGSGEVGRVYFLGATTDTPRFEPKPDFWLDAPAGSSHTFGWFTAGGFDYNGDGLPDVAATDNDNETVTLFY
jgi:hypothetical protein